MNFIVKRSVSSVIPSLKSITIPNQVTKIGKYAFHGCSSIKEITIPEMISHIGKDAFTNCSSLTSITILNPTPPLIESDSFDIEEINVPKESLTKYKRSKIWKKIAKYTPIN